MSMGAEVKQIAAFFRQKNEREKNFFLKIKTKFFYSEIHFKIFEYMEQK
jgi:hypothetical protein